jgi:hypothetical protein
MELPDRKDLPDYYKVIANPISLSDIEVSLTPRRYVDGRIECCRASTKLGRTFSWMLISCARTHLRITKMIVRYTRMLGRSR